MLLLCVTVLSLSMAQPAKAVVTEVALASALLATLAAFGISMSAADGINSVGPWVIDRFEDFVNSLGESVDVVVDKIRYGVDKAGNFIGNSYALSYNARFAQWLQTEYSLIDNSSVSLPSVSSGFLPQISGSPSYQDVASLGFITNHYVDRQTNISYANYDASSAPFTMVFCVLVPGSNVIQHNFDFSDRPATITYWADSFRGNNTFGSYVLSSSIDGIYYYQHTFPNLNTRQDIPTYFPGDGMIPVQSFDQALEYYRSVIGSSVSISTGSIDIPQVGDYTDEDGFILDGLGGWGDTLQDIWNKVNGLTFPDSVWPTVDLGIELSSALVDALVSSGVITTENSPGFFNGLPLISGIPDFSFGDLWHYVTDWVGYMSGGLSLIGGIMFSLPFVAAFYALVVILIVLSLWRLLRSA